MLRRLLPLFFLVPALSAQQVFTPVADAGTNYADSSRNYGSDDLRVEWDRHTVWRNVERSFLRFDVSGVQGQGYDCVTLRLRASSGGDTHFEVRLARGAWEEGDVNWQSQPATGRVMGSWTETVSSGETIDIPLSDILARRDGRVELALVGVAYGGSGQIRFDSREDGSPPQLIYGCSGGGDFRAGLTTTVRVGPAPLVVPFTNVSSGDATAWTWDFGDGVTSTERAPRHTYTQPGRYAVTLTATGPRGSHTQTRPGYVFVHPADTPVGSVHDWDRISQIRGGGPPLDNEDMFGRAVDSLGDLDGDGVVDLIVGSLGDDDAFDSGGLDQPGRADDNRGNNPGAAYVLFLNADGTVRAHQKISNLYGGLGDVLDDVDGFGRYVGGIGDLDGDGIPDACVTACRDDDGGSNRGALYVLFLRRDGTVREVAKISDTAGGFTGDLDNDDQFGRGVTSLGDLDGDGVLDLATGATGDDDGGGSRGAVWILYMNPDGTVKDHAKISDTEGGRQTQWDGRWFGMDVELLGDVNGDGIPDLGVGVLLDDSWLHASGAAFVLLLNRDGSVKGEYYIDAFEGMANGELEPGDEFGGSLAGIGDLDGDGVPDMAVGSIRDDDNEGGDLEIGVDSGAVFVYLLNPDGSVKDYQKISDTRGSFDDRIDRYDRFGEALGALGDFNGDGIPDLVVGTRFHDDGGANKGALHLLYLNDGNLRPVEAGFTAAPQSGDVPLTVSFSDTSVGEVTDWSWDFGDGGTASASSPTHVYTQAGTFSVTLTASGLDASSSLTRTDLIVVSPGPVPVADFSAGPELNVAPAVIDFVDRSAGFVTDWSWDFGDGSTSSLSDPTHTYTTPGTYDVTLTVSGPGGSDTLRREELLVVGGALAPVADFALDVSGGEAPLEVAFRSLSSGAVEGLAWDFGDGGTSTERNPTHVFSTPGLYAVSLTASGPLGSDTAVLDPPLLVDAAPAPVASFSSTTTTGSAPLVVAFFDTSTGPIDTWSWDFGDGVSSSESEPIHVYNLPGTYDVSLTVAGPGGNDTWTVPALVQVDGTVTVGFPDGGFEAQVADELPGAPWSVFAGDGHRVIDATPDAGFPTQGSRWLELSTAGGGAADGPTRPGNFTLPANGGQGVAHPFRLPLGQTTLAFEAAFLLGGTPGSALDNDWMSVDVSAGGRTLNLFYADSFEAFPTTSTLHGLPTTAVRDVRIDLAQAFVGADTSTDFVLTVQVGDGGGAGAASLGRLDGVRLEPTLTNMQRIGCGLNPAGSMPILAGQPILGEALTLGVDNPLGTQPPGSLPFLMLAFDPDPAYPCGTVFGLAGMSGGPGELLVSRIPPDPIRTIAGAAWSDPGFPISILVALPQAPSLAATNLYAQGYVLDLSPGASPRIGLTDAVQFLLTAPTPVVTFEPGLEASYYTGLAFDTLQLTRVDPVVDFDWVSGEPDPSVGPDGFSVRWEGFVEAPFDGDFDFITTSDDGVRLWVDGNLLVDDWTNHAAREGRGTLALTGGERVPLVLEYYENGGFATMRLEWEAAGLPREVIPAGALQYAVD